MERLRGVIDQAHAGLRLDRALAQTFGGLSRSFLRGLIEAGQITVDAEPSRARHTVKGGEQIEIWFDTRNETTILPQPMTLDIRYADEDLIVINKPAGLTVHPGAGAIDGTLLNGLLHFDAQLGALPRAGIVHRLDKDTSGLMVIARSLRAHTRLVHDLQARAIDRHYRAIVNGVLISGGSIDEPIGRHPKHRTKMAVIPAGKPAVTHYRVIQRFSAHTHLDVRLETGRTHQIRVHMAHIRHPLVGDTTYGARPCLPPGCSPELKALLSRFGRQALHAARLRLKHPASNEIMRWEVDPPDDFKQLSERLAEQCADD
jgi:23S rRNA pseudouridine1911/1915/1917 synthase